MKMYFRIIVVIVALNFVVFLIESLFYDNSIIKPQNIYRNQ